MTTRSVWTASLTSSMSVIRKRILMGNSQLQLKGNNVEAD